MQNSERPTLVDAAIFALILTAMFYGIGSYGLYEPHEAHFGGVGREMVLRGDWITPHLDGAPYLNKPPLLYWMIAISYSIFGISEWAARIPLALIGFSGVVLAWQWARELWGIRAGRMAAGILAVSCGWYLFSHQLMIDAMLSVLHLWTTYLLWKALNKEDELKKTQEISDSSFKQWTLFYFALGVSVLAKGLIGMFYPLGTLGIFALWRQIESGGGALGFLKSFPRNLFFWRWESSLLLRSRPFWGMTIVALLMAPWLVLIEMRNPGFLKYVLWNEHFQRVLNKRWPPDYAVSQVSWTAFIGIALVWLAPWTLLLPQIVLFTRKKIRESEGDHRTALILLTIAAVLPTALFIPVPSRLIYYCLPSLLPFALLAAGWWRYSGDSEQKTGRTLAGAAFTIIGAALTIGVIVTATSKSHHDLMLKIPDLKAASEIVEELPYFAALIAAALLTGGVLLLAKKPAESLIACCVLLGVGEAYNTRGFALFDQVRSAKKTVLAVEPKVGPDCVWISEGSKEIGATAGMAYYLQPKDGAIHQVLLMEDDSRRPPPIFPGPKASYLINQERLAEIWKAERPAVFVTDLLRHDWEQDVPYLPPQPRYEIELPDSGHRKVFANEAAWKKYNGK